jgi:hypothetical protein
MRVFIGGVEVIYPARWFFCDPNAKWFPDPHGAEAQPWLKDFEVNRDWGDVGDLKKLDRGINPGYPGQCSVGNAEWFLDGQLPADFLLGPDPIVPSCCGHLPPFNPDPRCPEKCSGCIAFDPKKVWHFDIKEASGQEVASGNMPGSLTQSCVWFIGNSLATFNLDLSGGKLVFTYTGFGPHGPIVNTFQTTEPIDCVNLPFVIDSSSLPPLVLTLT